MICLWFIILVIVTYVVLPVIKGLNTIHLIHKKLHYKIVFVIAADDKCWLLVSDKYEGFLEAYLFP